MSNQPQPIQEEDYPAFMQWVNSQPADSIIATSCDAEHCIVARWYSEQVGHPVYVNIKCHYLSEDDLNNLRWQYNPLWAMDITQALDRHTCMNHRDITQAEFVTQVLPVAYRLGLPEWKG